MIVMKSAKYSPLKALKFSLEYVIFVSFDVYLTKLLKTF